MGLNTYPSNPFPPSTDRMDADVLEAEVNKLESDVDQLKSGLTNYQVQNGINLEVPDRKNLLPLTLDGVKAVNNTGTWADNVYTVGGVEFTLSLNSDGYVTSINIDGTNTSGDNIDFRLINSWNSTNAFVTAGSYTMSMGNDDALAIAGYGQTVLLSNGGADPATKDCPNGIAFVFVRVTAGKTLSDMTFYPMIRPATITDPTFAPYIPSVESRIEAVESGQIIKTSETVTLNANGVSRLSLTLSQGRIVYAIKVGGGNDAYLVLPYCTTVDGGVWAVKVVDPTDMSPIASAEVIIAYSYLP